MTHDSSPDLHVVSRGADDECSARKRRGHYSTFAFVGVVAFAAAALWAGLLILRFEAEEWRFDFLRWEITNIPNKWLYALGRPLRDDLSSDEAILHYFSLDDRSGVLAARLEPVVEAAIEGRINRVLEELGIVGRVPLPGSVFPPVDVQLALPPRVLVTSPREQIKRIDDQLLRPGLSLDEVVELERAIEEHDPQLSALVLRPAGVALYPAVVSADSTYTSTLSIVAHEWVHHYLSFYPLGVSYFRSQELRTLNETVADIVGDEVAARVLERFGDPTEGAPSSLPGDVALSGIGGPDSRDEYVAEVLRALRLEVNDLLAARRIEEAERRMEQVREGLASEGIWIRRINQAYFAWLDNYAARADSVDPLGGELRELRERLGSLETFINEVREVTSRAQVQELGGRVGER